MHSSSGRYYFPFIGKEWINNSHFCKAAFFCTYFGAALLCSFTRLTVYLCNTMLGPTCRCAIFYSTFDTVTTTSRYRELKYSSYILRDDMKIVLMVADSTAECLSAVQMQQHIQACITAVILSMMCYELFDNSYNSYKIRRVFADFILVAGCMC